MLKTQGYDAAFHVGSASHDPEAVQIRLFERPGVALSAAMQKEIEKHFTRQELRRVPFGEVGAISYPARARESVRDDLLAGLDVGGDPRCAASASSSTTATRPGATCCRSCSGRSASKR